MARLEYHKYLFEVKDSPSGGFEGVVWPPGAQHVTAARIRRCPECAER